jgi:hypothetical protein
MGGMWKAPLFLFALVCAQAANVGSTVFLGFWSGSELGWPQGRYMVLPFLLYPSSFMFYHPLACH